MEQQRVRPLRLRPQHGGRLTILRVTIGTIFAAHGAQKLFAPTRPLVRAA